MLHNYQSGFFFLYTHYGPLFGHSKNTFFGHSLSLFFPFSSFVFPLSLFPLFSFLFLSSSLPFVPLSLRLSLPTPPLTTDVLQWAPAADRHLYKWPGREIKRPGSSVLELQKAGDRDGHRRGNHPQGEQRLFLESQLQLIIC